MEERVICNKKDCLRLKLWKPEMPWVLDSDRYFVEASTVRVCTTCIHFLGFDNYCSETNE